MEHRRWTDERLDDLAEAIRNGFGRVDQDVRDTRAELHQEIRSTRTELKAEIAELRQWMFPMTIGMTVGFISVLAAILARGG